MKKNKFYNKQMQSIEIFFLFFYPSKLHTYILSLWLNMFHLMAVIRRHDRYQKKNNIVDTHTQTTTRKIQNECLNTHTLINKNTFTRKKKKWKKNTNSNSSSYIFDDDKQIDIRIILQFKSTYDDTVEWWCYAICYTQTSKTWPMC